MNIAELRSAVDRKLAAAETARQVHRREKTAVLDAGRKLETAQTAIAVCQQVAQTIQEIAHSKIADIVSRSLEAVFDEPYTFRIQFEQKRGRTEAVLLFDRGGMLVDPLTASGGGVVDVAAFALRLSCLLLSRPPLRRLVVLDEPFRFVSAEYRGRVRDLLVSLATELDCQFVIVTHMKEMQAGKVIEL